MTRNPLDADYLADETEIDHAEHDALLARWRCGRRILAERQANGGKQLPHGRMDELCALVGKSSTELSNRAKFAEQYPDPEKVSNALETFQSWYGICSEGLGERSNAQRMQSSETNEWYTPAPYIESARAVLGGIDLDPASCAEANQVVQAARFYTADDDGLARDWKGRVWLNPPYGGQAGAFVAKLISHYDAGDVPAAVCLVSSHSPETDWFRPLWDRVLCFTYGRIAFTDSSGEAAAPTHGSVFAYLGPDRARFAAEFEPHGAVVARWPGNSW